jgi:hypothetical protein
VICTYCTNFFYLKIKVDKKKEENEKSYPQLKAHKCPKIELCTKLSTLSTKINTNSFLGKSLKTNKRFVKN